MADREHEGYKKFFYQRVKRIFKSWEELYAPSRPLLDPPLREIFIRMTRYPPDEVMLNILIRACVCACEDSFPWDNDSPCLYDYYFTLPIKHESCYAFSPKPHREGFGLCYVFYAVEKDLAHRQSRLRCDGVDKIVCGRVIFFPPLINELLRLCLAKKNWLEKVDKYCSRFEIWLMWKENIYFLYKKIVL